MLDGPNEIRVKLLEAAPAKMAPYVQLETLPESQEAKIVKRLALWRARGVDDVEAMLVAAGATELANGQMTLDRLMRIADNIEGLSTG